MKKFSFGRLGRRYGKAKGGGSKRYEGVSVKREPRRLYYVGGDGKVMSTPMKRR